MLTEIEFSDDERAAGMPNADRVVAGARALRTHGCVMLRDVFSTELVGAWRNEFMAGQAALRSGTAPRDGGMVGGGRFLTSLGIAGAFHTPQLYANSFVMPILRAILGESLVLGCFGAVTSLPGAPAQHIHRDGGHLFNKAVNRLITAHAIDVFVPLVEFNDRTGTTRLFPRTHLDLDADPAVSPYVDPVVPLGSCLLMDYRLLHQGRENRSDQLRPLLFSVYHLPWFKDYNNYPRGPFLRITDEDYARIPAEHRSLLAWTEHYRAGLY